MEFEKKKMFDEWNFFRMQIFKLATMFKNHPEHSLGPISFCFGGLYEIARRNAQELSQGEDWFKKSTEEEDDKA